MAFAWFLYFVRYPKGLIEFHSKNSHLWKFNVAGKSNKYLGFRVIFSIFCPILHKIGFIRHAFIELFNIKFGWNISSGSRVDTSREREREQMEEYTELRASSRLWNAHKIISFQFHKSYLCFTTVTHFLSSCVIRRKTKFVWLLFIGLINTENALQIGGTQLYN